jgi:hypothetical protein
LTTSPWVCLIRRSNSGQVAQLVEQRTENPRVGGSIPSLATISSSTDIHRLPQIEWISLNFQCFYTIEIWPLPLTASPV